MNEHSPPPALPTAGLTRSRLILVLAAILWSTSGLFAYSPLIQSWPAVGGLLPPRGTMLVFWRALFAGLFLLPFVRRPQWSPVLIPGSILFAVMSITFLTGMTLTSAANTIWLQSSAPLWVFLIGVFLLREPARRQDYLPLGLGLLGVAVILFFELRRTQTGSGELLGVMLGLSSGLFYACVVLSLRMLRTMDSFWLISLYHLVTAAIFLPFIVWQGIWPDGRQLLLMAAFGGIQMGLPYVLFAYAVRRVISHEAAGIVLLEPVLLPVWTWLAWRGTAAYHPPAWWTFVGAAFILAGLLIRCFTASKEISPAPTEPEAESDRLEKNV